MDATAIDIIRTEARGNQGGGAVILRVRSPFGDFHLEVPLEQKALLDRDKTRAEIQKTMIAFGKALSEATYDDMEFRP
jgi:hypothetical protein